MVVPEDVQELTVSDLCGVEIDLDRLAVVAQAAVGGIGLGSAGVADSGSDDSGQAPKLGVRAPESAHGESRGLRDRGGRQIDGRPVRPLLRKGLFRNHACPPLIGDEPEPGGDGCGERRCEHDGFQQTVGGLS